MPDREARRGLPKAVRAPEVALVRQMQVHRRQTAIAPPVIEVVPDWRCLEDLGRVGRLEELVEQCLLHGRSTGTHEVTDLADRPTTVDEPCEQCARTGCLQPSRDRWIQTEP